MLLVKNYTHIIATRCIRSIWKGPFDLMDALSNLIKLINSLYLLLQKMEHMLATKTILII
jgi:hypothetical protein